VPRGGAGEHRDPQLAHDQLLLRLPAAAAAAAAASPTNP
jgi:hypothetical protein